MFGSRNLPFFGLASEVLYRDCYDRMFKEIEKYFDEDWKDWNGLLKYAVLLGFENLPLSPLSWLLR